MTPQVILVGGGVRSGKSAFALERARSIGKRRAFLATAQPFDREMTERIALHRSERGDDFKTIEEAIAIAERLDELQDIDVVVLDCVTIWLSNLMLCDRSLKQILADVDELVAVVARRRFSTIIVTNEVGMGVVPETPLGRTFRDVCGLTHQRLAREADEIDVAILGSVLQIKPAPVRLHSEVHHAAR
jgi:adenosylcobinamide kinase/adenosylcobinamide-phosphate guanylyltransferase